MKLGMTMLLWLGLLLLSCKKKGSEEPRAINYEELEVTNSTALAVRLIYVDSLYSQVYTSKSFTLNIPANTVKKLDLGRYYVDSEKGFLDFCELRGQMVMGFADGKYKRDTSCFGVGNQNFADKVNFFNTVNVYTVGLSPKSKIYTYRYTITNADYMESK